MSKTIAVVNKDLVVEFSIESIMIKALNKFMEDHPGRDSGDLQTATLANQILIKLLLEE